MAAPAVAAAAGGGAGAGAGAAPAAPARAPFDPAAFHDFGKPARKHNGRITTPTRATLGSQRETYADTFFESTADEVTTMTCAPCAVSGVTTDIRAYGSNFSNFFSHLKRVHHAYLTAADQYANDVGAGEVGQKRARGSVGLYTTISAKVLAAGACLGAHPFGADVGQLYLLRTLLPSARVPTRNTVVAALEALFAAKKAEMRAKVAKLTEGGAHVSLAADLWTSGAGTPMLGLEVTGVTAEGQYASITVTCMLMPYPHTAALIKDTAERACAEMGFDASRCAAYVTDNGANVVAAFTPFAGASLRCFIHSAQLPLAETETGVDWFNGALVAARDLTSKFTSSPKRAQALAAKQRALGVPTLAMLTVSPTRWHCKIFQLKRVLTNLRALGDLTPTELGATTAEYQRFRTLVDVVDAARPACEAIMPCLDMTMAITDEMSVRGPTLGLVRRNIRRVRDAATALAGSDDENVAAFGAQLRTTWTDRFEGWESYDYYVLAAVLDPRTVHSEPMPTALMASAMTVLEASVLVTAEERTAAAPAVQAIEHANEFAAAAAAAAAPDTMSPFRREVAKYYSAVASILGGPVHTMDPLAWMRKLMSEDGLVIIPRAMRTIFGMQAASVEPERLFSRAGLIISKRRSRLSSKRAEMQILLARWLRDDPDVLAVVPELEAMRSSLTAVEVDDLESSDAETDVEHAGIAAGGVAEAV